MTQDPTLNEGRWRLDRDNQKIARKRGQTSEEEGDVREGERERNEPVDQNSKHMKNSF